MQPSSSANLSTPRSMVSHGSLVQDAINQLYARRALAHRRGDALGAAAAHVAHCEDAGPAGFEEMRRTRVRPLRRREVLGMQVRSRQHEALVVKRKAALQPAS